MKAWVLFKRNSKTNYQDKFLAFWLQKPEVGEVEKLIRGFFCTSDEFIEDKEYHIQDSDYFFKVCKEDTLYDR